MAERERFEQRCFLLMNQLCLFGRSDDAHRDADILSQKETRRSGSQWRVRLGKIVDGAPDPRGLRARTLAPSARLTITTAD